MKKKRIVTFSSPSSPNFSSPGSLNKSRAEERSGEMKKGSGTDSDQTNKTPLRRVAHRKLKHAQKTVKGTSIQKYIDENNNRNNNNNNNSDESSESSGSEIDEANLVLSPISMESSSRNLHDKNKTFFKSLSKEGTGAKKRGLKRSSSALTPDVVIINGRRLPASVVEYAIAGDLTEEQLDEYEKNLLIAEQNEEDSFKNKQRGILAESKSRRPRLFKRRKSMGSSKQDEGSSIPFPRGRLAYLGIPNEVNLFQANIFSRFFPQTFGGMSKNDDSTDDKPHLISSDSNNRTMINRHLKRSVTTNKRTLSVADQELLRNVGLDTFVMLRFLRFGFDTTFYPFLIACLVLIPTYFTHEFNPGEFDNETQLPLGYFRVTMNRLEAGNPKHWISVFFAFFYYCFILRRLWVEWETFIPLRHDFLAHGEIGKDKKDAKITDELIDQKDDTRLHLRQFQNSCMVQFIPGSHRRDQELYHYFNLLFPNGVKRAEILLNATKLTNLINKRQKYIMYYEDIYAKQYHANQLYRQKLENQRESDIGIFQYLCCRCYGHAPKKPVEIRVKQEGAKRCYCGTRKLVKALPYYLSEIKRLNMEIKKEHRRISKEKQTVEDKDGKQLLTAGIAGAMKFVTGVGGDLNVRFNICFMVF